MRKTAFVKVGFVLYRGAGSIWEDMKRTVKMAIFVENKLCILYTEVTVIHKIGQ